MARFNPTTHFTPSSPTAPLRFKFCLISRAQPLQLEVTNEKLCGVNVLLLDPTLAGRRHTATEKKNRKYPPSTENSPKKVSRRTTIDGGWHTPTTFYSLHCRRGPRGCRSSSHSYCHLLREQHYPFGCPSVNPPVCLYIATI